MIAVNNSIIVSVNMEQKDEALICGQFLKTGRNYNENFRERNPVVARVEKGCKEIPAGSYIVCNYSYFDEESPLYLYDNYYYIPIDSEIYAIINPADGSLTPVMGNVLVERITKESNIELPEELKKPYLNRGIGISGTVSWGNIEGVYLFWLNFSDYQIVYTWGNKEMRALKVHESEITGYLK